MIVTPVVNQSAVNQRVVIGITGGNGFIGKHLSDICFRLGFGVASINRDTLYDIEAIKQVIVDNKIHILIHLAAYGNHSDQTNEPEILATNVFLTFNILEAIKNLKLNAFINTSSSSVYGKTNEEMSENMPVHPETFYAITKYQTELLTTYYAKNYGVNAINIRPFSVFGIGEADFRFIPTIIHNALNNKLSYVDETATHDWVYVDDVCDAILGLIYQLNEKPAIRGGTFNIGTGKETTNKQIVEIIEKIHKKPIKYENKKFPRLWDSPRWQADATLLKSIGWRPNLSLEEALKLTYDYYKSRPKKKNN